MLDVSVAEHYDVLVCVSIPTTIATAVVSNGAKMLDGTLLVRFAIRPEVEG